MKKLLIATALSACAVLSVNAQDRQYNEVHFSVNVQKQVANDELHASLSKTFEHTQAKTLANTLNSTANKVLALAKKYPNVKVATGHQHSYPRYDNKGKMNGFVGSVALKVQSQDFEQASEFIAEAQSLMTLGDLTFQVSDKTQQAMQNSLKLELIQKFNEEAKTTAQAFGAKNYKLIKVNLNGNEQNQYYHAPMAMAVSQSSSKATPQEFVGGDSYLQYNATGSIELVY